MDEDQTLHTSDAEDVFQEILKRLKHLQFTKREIEIMSCIACGRSSRKAIASVLRISPRTVDAHSRNIIYKIKREKSINSKGIIEFIESSNSNNLFQAYYELVFLKMANICKIDQNKAIKILDEETTLNNKYSLYPYFKKKIILITTISLCLCLGLYFVFANNNSSSKTVYSEPLLPRLEVLLPRNELIQKIKEKLNVKTDENNSVVISGLAGAGKTILARMVAKNSKIPLVIEVKGSSLDRVKESFERIAFELATTPEHKATFELILKIQKRHELDTQLLNFVRTILKEESKKWLLIFDNVDSFKDLEGYLPQNKNNWGDGWIIVTTRNDNFEGDNVLHIGELTHEESCNLFEKIMKQGRVKSTGYNEKIDGLLSNIPPFPLDVSIAANYIQQTCITFDEYKDRMKCKDFYLTQEAVLKDVNEYSKSRYRVIELALESIKNNNFQFIEPLILMSIVSYQDIPRCLLEESQGKDGMDVFIHLLKQHSLLLHNEVRTQEISLHQSIQNIFRQYWISNIEEFREHYMKAISTFVAYLDKVLTKEDFFEMKNAERHVLEVLNFPVLQDEQKALLLCKLTCLQAHLGISTQEIISSLEKNIPLLNKEKALLHVATSLVYLGDGYKRIGDYKKATIVLKESAQIFYDLNSKNIGLAQALTYLGTIYRILGDYEEAKKYLLNAKDIFKSLDVQHSGESQNSVYLGLVYKDLGEYDLAISSIQSSLDFWNSKGSDPMWVAWASAYLANVFFDIGDIKQAKSLISESIALHKQHINSPIWLAWADTVLGGIHLSEGNASKAIELLEKSKITYEKKHTNNYVYFTMLLVFLGEGYMEQGQYDQASSLLNKSLSLIEEQFGQGHLQTGRVLHKIGLLYLKQNNLELAKTYMNMAKDIWKKYEHPDLSIAYEGLGQVYEAKALNAELEKKEEYQAKASKNYEEALNIVKEHLPNASSKSSRILERLNQLKY